MHQILHMFVSVTELILVKFEGCVLECCLCGWWCWCWYSDKKMEQKPAVLGRLSRLALEQFKRRIPPFVYLIRYHFFFFFDRLLLRFSPCQPQQEFITVATLKNILSRTWHQCDFYYCCFHSVKA